MIKKVETSAAKVFFTSDLHFGHEGIIQFASRPYQGVREMDESLIHNWNNTVPEDGLVFVLGDIGFTDSKRIARIFEGLNGEKVLIKGNHDDRYSCSTLEQLFSEIHDILYVRIFDAAVSKYCYISLCHYPMLDWQSSFRGSWQLFGHLHTRPMVSEFENHFKKLLFPVQYDVGVDNNSFRPVSFYEVKDIIAQQLQDGQFKRSNYGE